MGENQPINLSDVLETLQELNQAVKEQARVHVQLDAEKAALARRLNEALAAERRQRCRVMSSRTFARRAQAAALSVINVQKELLILKRELVMQKKTFQEDRKILEDKICALQQENVRINEEKEAALAIADFAKEENEAFNKNVNQGTSSTVANTRPPARVESLAEALTPPRSRSRSRPHPLPHPHAASLPTLQLQPQPAAQLERPRPWSSPARDVTGNSLWTESGLVPSPLNLITRAELQSMASKKSAQTTRYKAVAGFRTASQLMQACRGEGEENQACTLRVTISQSDSTVKADDQSVPVSSDDDCVIVFNEWQDPAMVKIEEVKSETPTTIQEEQIQADNVSQDTDTNQIPLKKPRKKRRMFTTPHYDEFTE